MTTKERKTAAERYKEQGLQQFACWLPPETILKIKTMANLQGMKIPELITAKFNDVKIERGTSRGKLVVKFSRVEEETEIS
jgi:hypothetical protein